MIGDDMTYLCKKQLQTPRHRDINMETSEMFLTYKKVLQYCAAASCELIVMFI